MPDADLILESHREELRALMASLNDLLHPVHGGPAAQIADLERRIAELKDAMRARRQALAAH